jgi:hypothetical protein
MIEIICVGMQGKIIDLGRDWVVKSAFKADKINLKWPIAFKRQRFKNTAVNKRSMVTFQQK